jgi:hypothetical protein
MVPVFGIGCSRTFANMIPVSPAILPTHISLGKKSFVVTFRGCTFLTFQESLKALTNSFFGLENCSILVTLCLHLSVIKNL